MLRYQLPDGRFHDLLDEPESFPDGTSAMMTAATIYRGIRHGYLDPVYAPCADQALRTVAGCMDEMGMIHGVCGCPDFVSEGTSAEAQAAFVMAEAWKEKVSDPS
jgi:rhamnogalacturonyl hydrolase YesR